MIFSWPSIPELLNSHVQLKKIQVVENIKLPKHGGRVSCMNRQNVEGTERVFMARRHVDCGGFGETRGNTTLKRRIQTIHLTRHEMWEEAALYESYYNMKTI